MSWLSDFSSAFSFVAALQKNRKYRREFRRGFPPCKKKKTKVHLRTLAEPSVQLVSPLRTKLTFQFSVAKNNNFKKHFMSAHHDVLGWRTATLSQPTIVVPAKRMETAFLLFLHVLTFTFVLSSALVEVYSYQSSKNGDVSIYVYHHKLKLCVSPSGSQSSQFLGGGCESVSLSTKLCEGLAQRINSAGGFAIFSIIVTIVATGFLVLEYTGKAIFTSRLTYAWAIILWFSLFLQWILDSAGFLENLCNSTSLRHLGFKYSAGWALPFVAWLLLSIGVVFYYFARRDLRTKRQAQ